MTRGRTLRQGAAGLLLLLVLTAGSLAASPLPGPSVPSSGDAQKMREEIQIDRKLGDLRRAFVLAEEYLREHPGDPRGYLLSARVSQAAGKTGDALRILDRGLALFPKNTDLLYRKAMVLLLEHRIGEARRILTDLYRKNPDDPGIRSDLLQTFEDSGLLRTDQSLSTNFLAGTATQPPPRPSVAVLESLSEWSLSSDVYSLLYPGGTALVVDTRLSTPLYGQNRFFTGRTEYLGFSQSAGNGTNAFTYAGTDWTLGERAHLLLEAGNTSVRPSAGLYGRLDSEEGPVSVSLQGFGNMVWGDFGESIAQNGVESGLIAQASWQIAPRLGVSAEYWYFDYALQNGTLPYGNLHNTEGMFDLNLTRLPHIDLVGGYDSWTVLSPPVVASRVPILLKQRYFMMGFSWEKHYESLWTLTAELGGYDDTYLHLASYEASGGIAYQLGSRWQFFANAYYFNQSTIVSGQTESYMGGFQFWF